MTINEAISYIDEYHPNTASFAMKLRWLNEAEAMVCRDIMRMCPISPYTNQQTDTELFAPIPYDRLYTYYLDAKLFELYHEYGDYVNSKEQFDNAFADYSAYYAEKYHPQRRIDELQREMRKNNGNCIRHRH